MKKQIIQLKDTVVDIALLKESLEKFTVVSAAYLFGSAASGEKVVNDLDILILLYKTVDKNEAYIDLTFNLSRLLNIPESCVDLLFLNVEDADPDVLTKAVNHGILLKNEDPDYLGNTIDAISRYLLENEAMAIRAGRLRQERLEVFHEAR